ncbi:MAG: transporter, ATP-binding protein [Solirubrobacterales bacterium]|nr:transporter, ATP-binding protein [Solirubrobacterales bacterium]
MPIPEPIDDDAAPGSGATHERAGAEARSRELSARVQQRQIDARRPGRGPFVTALRLEPGAERAVHPLGLAVMAPGAVRLDAPITLLTGDNGTGKSTYVETLADAMAFAPEGGELERSGELPARPRSALGGAVMPEVTGRKPRSGYFLRAESFFGVAAFVDGGGRFAPDLSLYGDIPLHDQSHGQSFLALAANRFGPEGLYLLDEPEAALSFSGQLALLAILVRAARGGAQVVVATHSPVLLACPEARIYELGEDTVTERTFDDLEAVRLLRGFLDAPERYLRAALDPDEG